MHVVFDESNPLDPRKALCSFNNIIDELVDMNIQGENTSKPLEFESPCKEDNEEMPQSTSKDELPKDWQFKKAHP